MLGSPNESNAENEIMETLAQIPKNIAEPIMKGASGNRAYVFTSWYICDPLSYAWDEMSVKYAVWQLEKCPRTGKLYHQGYVELLKTQRYAALKKKFPDPAKVWFSARKCTARQAREYCMKQDTRAPANITDDGSGPWEFGTFVGDVVSGRRRRSARGCFEGDRAAVNAMIKAGKNLMDINDVYSEFVQNNIMYVTTLIRERKLKAFEDICKFLDNRD